MIGYLNNSFPLQRFTVLVATSIITFLFCCHNSNNNNLLVEGRIVGGTKVGVSERPYFVFPDPTSYYICGGVLIWQDIVLTAAHCKRSFRDTNKVCIGGNDLACKTSRAIYDLSDIMITHPAFNTTILTNDIMLMKLSDGVPGPYVTLNSNSSIPAGVNQTLIAIGYGQIMEGFDAPLSESLLQVPIETSDYATCKAYWLAFKNRTVLGGSKAICTGSINGGRDTCFGDSGGPIFLPNSDIVAGITSYGRGCARPNVPAVNVRVSGYIAWIRSTVCAISASPPSYCSTLIPTKQAFFANSTDNTILSEFGSLPSGEFTGGNYSRQVIGDDLTILFHTEDPLTDAVVFKWLNDTRYTFNEPYVMTSSGKDQVKTNPYVSGSLGLKTITIEEYFNFTLLSSLTYNFEIVE